MPGRLTLYTRERCGLCSEMLAAARPIAERHGAAIECVDIDDDPDLAWRYNTIIPVLELGGREVARHHLDPGALERALEAESDA